MPAAVVLGAAYIGGRVIGDSPPSSHVHPQAIVWAGRVFTNRQEFAGWLRARGASYRVWAQRHPGVVAAQSHALDATPSVRPTGTPGQRRNWVRPLIAGVLVLAGGFVVVLTFRRRRRFGLVRRPRWERPGLRPRHPTLPHPTRPSPQLASFVRRFAAVTLAGGRALFTGAETVRYASRRLRPGLIERSHAHVDVGWYVAACLLAGAIGILLPRSFH
jgi:hypothetical protein